MAFDQRSRRNRTRARAWALQVLYRWESADSDSVLDALATTLANRRVAPGCQPHLVRVVRGFAEHDGEVRDAITEALDNWRIERLARVDRCILFLSVTEMLFVDGVPPAVAIQEAVRLAQRYGSEHSDRFVNGVLDAVLRARTVPDDR
ncbi:MAG: transcription antitermination factor NusB [Gammaproteobacteria bacterium]|nr:transcription antitermination factor NusB [Gammaproteobacteria bacterium]